MSSERTRELEVRLYLDPRNRKKPARFTSPTWGDNFTEIIKRATSAKGEISQVIDVYTPGKARKQIIFDTKTGLQTSQKWITKTVGIQYQDDNESGGYKISDAMETVQDGDVKKILNVDGIRLKVRKSIMWKENWRLDVTCIKNTSSMSALKTVRQQFIYPILDFSKAPFDQADWVEFEMEFMGAEHLKIDNVKPLVHDMYEHLLGWMPDNEHNAWIRWLVKQLDVPRNETFMKPGQMRLVHKYNLLLPRAREIGLEEWNEIRSSKVTIRKKVDGERVLLVVWDGKTKMFKSGSIRDVELNHSFDGKGLYVADVEYLNGVYYVLHMLIANDQSLEHKGDLERLQIKETDQVKLCPFYIGDTREAATLMWTPQTEKLALDGLLVTPDPTLGYWIQTVIKWKPLGTIDFLTIKCPMGIEGKAPYLKRNDGDTLYLLLVGCSNPHHLDKVKLPPMPSIRGYRPVLFSPQQKPFAHILSHPNPDLHGLICECIFHDDKWEMKKIRTDKLSILAGGVDMGNNIRTALDTFTKYFQPFKLEDLWREEQKTRTIIPSGCIPPDTSHVILYRPPLDLIPPRVKHMITIGPMQIGSIRDVAEPKSLNFELPSEFIGGSPLVLSFQLPPSGVKRWAKTMQAVTAPGGTIIHLGEEKPDPGSDFRPLESGRWIRSISGNKIMTREEVHAENPHTRGNPEAAFVYKFTRQKTKDMGAWFGEERKQNYDVWVERGQMLCYVEFLSKFPAGTRVMIGEGIPKSLKTMFPEHNFIDNDVEVFISCVWSEELLEKIKPRESLLLYTPPTDSKTFQIPRCRLVLMPYQDPSSRSILLWISGACGPKTSWWNIQTQIWNSEMRFFHHVYRPSGFKYQKPRELSSTFDHCWDCRSEIFILTKYIKGRKDMTIEKAVDLLDL